MNFNYELLQVQGLFKNMKNPSFIKTQMINDEMFAFPKKIKKDCILKMDLELCKLDPFLLNDVNEYPDPAK